MSTQADRLLGAVLKHVRQSGILEALSVQGTVDALNSNGTATIKRGTDTHPKVRLLTSYLAPAVGDTVQIMRTLSGWVCLGAYRSNSAPRIQSGRVSITNGSATAWSNNVVVTFPKPFASAPVVTATPNDGGPGTGNTDVMEVQVTGATTTTFNVRVKRGTASLTTVIGWIATDF